MKLRLVKTKDEIKLLCMNGSILKVDTKVLKSLLTNFKRPSMFKGNEEFWSNTCANMEDVRGETLAYVDYCNALVIVNEEAFASIVEQEDYISASEYADLHGKGRAMIKRLCMEGRLPGAYKTSSGWLIPKNAPYPERKTREVKQNP